MMVRTFKLPDLPELTEVFDPPLPKYRFWKRVRPPPEPVLCERCQQDTGGTEVHLGSRRVCLACAAAEAKAQKR